MIAYYTIAILYVLRMVVRFARPRSLGLRAAAMWLLLSISLVLAFNSAMGQLRWEWLKRYGEQGTAVVIVKGNCSRVPYKGGFKVMTERPVSDEVDPGLLKDAYPISHCIGYYFIPKEFPEKRIYAEEVVRPSDFHTILREDELRLRYQPAQLSNHWLEDYRITRFGRDLLIFLLVALEAGWSIGRLKRRGAPEAAD